MSYHIKKYNYLHFRIHSKGWTLNLEPSDLRSVTSQQFVEDLYLCPPLKGFLPYSSSLQYEQCISHGWSGIASEGRGHKGTAGGLYAHLWCSKKGRGVKVVVLFATLKQCIVESSRRSVVWSYRNMQRSRILPVDTIPLCSKELWCRILWGWSYIAVEARRSRRDFHIQLSAAQIGFRTAI